MKKVETDVNDELRPEYDLRSLRVRKLGRGRKSFGGVVRLEPDVAEVFPDASLLSVFLILYGMYLLITFILSQR